VARDIGSAAWLLVIWLVTGLITAAALSYGELAGMMPKAGGQFVYIQRSYGRLVSFMAGPFYSYTNWSYCAIANICHHAAIFFPVLDTVLLNGVWFCVFIPKVLAVLSIILFMAHENAQRRLTTFLSRYMVP
jgi:APA family basic amino acid/polyamine antiporter